MRYPDAMTVQVGDLVIHRQHRHLVLDVRYGPTINFPEFDVRCIERRCTLGEHQVPTDMANWSTRRTFSLPEPLDATASRVLY